LGLDRLPFKITIAAMAEIASWALRSNSYDDAEKGLRSFAKIRIKNDTIRFVANTVGKIVLDNEMARAEDSYRLLNSGRLSFPTNKLDSELYIDCGGAMFLTREKDDNGDYKREENKLGVVFGSDSFIRWTNSKGEREKRIGKREYTAYAGSADVFQKMLFDLAIRNGYGRYKTTILLSDGATWVKNMKDLSFPEAVLILDFFRLREKTLNFSKEYFDNNESIYRPWADKICKMLRNSETR
jgi:hypothetical protein